MPDFAGSNYQGTAQYHVHSIGDSGFYVAEVLVGEAFGRYLPNTQNDNPWRTGLTPNDLSTGR